MQVKDGNENTKSSPNLFSQAVKGSFWVISIRVIAQVLSIGRYILLMNVLQVKDMGLLGIAFLMIQTLDTFTNTGFNAALTQKEDVKSYLSTAWAIGIIRAFILFAILYFTAPFFVDLKPLTLQESSLTISVIRVLGLSFFIGSLSNIGVIYFQKELQFHKQFLLQTLPTLISITVSVILVIIYESVWSLVIGRMSANVFKCIISYIMHPFRPKFKIDIQKAKELWSFGKWVFGATIIGFLITQGDDFFVWVYIDAAALALYQAAYKFSNIPATEITHVISKVSFPAYSKLQHDIPRLKNSYLKILKMTACLSMPVSGLIFILTPEFVTIFIRPEWHSIIPIMRIMVIAAMLRSFGATTGPLYLAVGRPDISPKISSYVMLLLAVIIYPLTKYMGISGTAIALLAVTIFIQPIAQFYVVKILKCSFSSLITIAIPPLISTLGAIAVVLLTKHFFQTTTITYFTLASLLGILVYLEFLFAIDRIFNYGIIKIIKEQIAVLKSK